MKRTLAIILSLSIMLSAASAATQTSLDQSFTSFANDVADFVPRASAGSNLWADAHIGNLLPLNGLPHLGAGFSASFAMIPTDFTSTFGSAFTTPVNTWESFPLPAISIDARVGGLILPFDIGAHIFALNNFEKELWGLNIEIPSCLAVGADLRFAILQEGVILPALSIGVGYTYSKGDFTISSRSMTDIASMISQNQAVVNYHMEYETAIYSATVQLSKKILLLTPFIGAKAIAQSGTYKYAGAYNNIDGKSNSFNLTTLTKNFALDDLQNSMANVKYNIFAGLGVDFLIIQTTVGVSYDLSDQSWAGSASIHLKI